MTTIRNSIGLINGSQTGYAVWNSSVREIAALTFGQIIDTENNPPATPSLHDMYIVGNSPTGAWVNANPNDIAYYNSDSQWMFFAPNAGLKIYDASSGTIKVYDGFAWVDVSSGSGGGNTIPLVASLPLKIKSSPALQTMTIDSPSAYKDIANGTNEHFNFSEGSGLDTVSKTGSGSTLVNVGNVSTVYANDFANAANFTGTANQHYLGASVAWMNSILNGNNFVLSFLFNVSTKPANTTGDVRYTIFDCSDGTNTLFRLEYQAGNAFGTRGLYMIYDNGVPQLLVNSGFLFATYAHMAICFDFTNTGNIIFNYFGSTLATFPITGVTNSYGSLNFSVGARVNGTFPAHNTAKVTEISFIDFPTLPFGLDVLENLALSHYPYGYTISGLDKFRFDYAAPLASTNYILFISATTINSVMFLNMIDVDSTTSDYTIEIPQGVDYTYTDIELYLYDIPTGGTLSTISIINSTNSYSIVGSTSRAITGSTMTIKIRTNRYDGKMFVSMF